MGEKSENMTKVKAYIGDQCIGEFSAGLPEITSTPELPEGVESVSLTEPIEITGTIYWNPKPKKCRTRKRFIKLLMADGMSRNAANWWAGKLKKGASYKQAYHFLKWRQIL